MVIVPSNANDNPYHDRDWLYDQYVETDLDTSEISDRCGVTEQTIDKWCAKFDLEDETVVRTCPFCDAEFATSKRVDRECCSSDECVVEWVETKDDPADNKDVLRVLHTGVRMAPHEIADFLNTETPVITARLDDYGLKETALIPWEDEETLRELYWDERLTPEEMANRWGCTVSIVKRKLQRYAIETRSRGARKAEKHPRWAGGDMEYGPNWSEQRRKALERDTPEDGDEPVCQRCGMTDSTHKAEYGSALYVHHITPRREFVDATGEYDYEAANRLENLITVCCECHTVWEKCQPLRLQPAFADADAFNGGDNAE